jgi:hypothetical protein
LPVDESGAHPSFLTLDRAALGRKTPEVATHLDAAGGCERCREHLASVEVVPAPLPPWLATLQPRQARQVRQVRPTWVLPVALAASALVALGLFMHLPAVRPATAKGAPSIALYVKHGDSVELWDGHSPLQPGDRVRLQISADGFRYATVTAPHQEQPLFKGEVDPEKPALLPDSWRVDDAPGDEGLILALSAHPLEAGELEAAQSAKRRDAEIWTTELRLPKTTQAPESAKPDAQERPQ